MSHHSNRLISIPLKACVAPGTYPERLGKSQEELIPFFLLSSVLSSFTAPGQRPLQKFTDKQQLRRLLQPDLESRGLLDSTLSAFSPHSMQKPGRKYHRQQIQPHQFPAQNPPMASHCPQDKVGSLAWHSRLFMICQSHQLTLLPQ